MKPFNLDTHKVTLRGVFYPTGHVLLMLPGREEAEQAARRITEAGITGDDVSLLPLLYPYWHQCNTVAERLSAADLSLQAGTFSSKFATRFAPATFTLAVIFSLLVGWWLLT